MKEIPMPGQQHKQVSHIVYKAKIDIGILPLVKWLNSYKGVLTRWSCEGQDGVYPAQPYIIVWVETRTETNPWSIDDGTLNEWNIAASYLRKFAIQIRRLSTMGDIKVLDLRFQSHADMLAIQKSLLKMVEKDKKWIKSRTTKVKEETK